MGEYYNLTIEKGSVERLHIQIPWSQLYSGKCNVEIEGVTIVTKVGFPENINCDIFDNNIKREDLNEKMVIIL